MQLASDLMRKLGHEVKIFGSRVGQNGIDAYEDEYCAGANGKLQVLLSTYNVSARAKLSTVLKNYRPDIVHLHMFLWQLSPSIMGLLRDFPTIYHIHTYKPVCPTGLKILPSGAICSAKPGRVCLQEKCLTPQSWVFNMIQRVALRDKLDVINSFLTPSKFMRAELEKNGIGPTTVLANGCPVVEQRSNLSEKPVVAYAGRLAPEKGVMSLLRAIKSISAEIPDVRLNLVGEGPQKSELLQSATHLGISENVVFKGRLSRNETEVALKNAWVQVVPSLWNEPFGNVAIEAMMRGTAVVSSDVGGLAEIFDDNGGGLLFEAGNVDDLSAKLRQLLTDQNSCQEMGDCGRSIAMEKYTIQKHVEGLLTHYQKVIRS